MSWLNAFLEASSATEYLKLLNQPVAMKKDVAAYMRDYNFERLHATNADQSSINHENSPKKCPVGLDQNTCIILLQTKTFSAASRS